MIRSANALLAAMTHGEVLMPLDTILEMADRLVQSELDPDQRKFAEILRNGARSLARVLEDSLALSRFDRGGIELAREPFEVAELVYECRDAFAVAVHRKDLQLVAHVTPEAAGTAIGDAHQVRRVLFNLLGNAVKFTETGRIALRARATSDLAYLVFEVEDTGIGIPRELQAVIFERFVQGDSGTERRYGGCGLGLALARALVLSMGGGIGVTSAPGAGALFRVALPLAVKPRFGG
jgi:signal transduction histidine kinase